MITESQRRQIKSEQKFRCACCSCLLQRHCVHIDHKIETQYMGSNERSNLQALCVQCHYNKTLQCANIQTGQIKKKHDRCTLVYQKKLASTPHVLTLKLRADGTKLDWYLKVNDKDLRSFAEVRRKLNDQTIIFLIQMTKLNVEHIRRIEPRHESFWSALRKKLGGLLRWFYSS